MSSVTAMLMGGWERERGTERGGKNGNRKQYIKNDTVVNYYYYMHTIKFEVIHFIQIITTENI